jgi:cation transport regulator ChaC
MYDSNFIFGYGSLMNFNNLQKYLRRSLTLNSDFMFCNLNNFRRCWNIAMNNSLDLPNYKYYIDPETGIRPKCFVTFLNIRPAPNNVVMGVLFRVSDKELEQLDWRERNYYRVEITNSIDRPIEGKAWVYLGLEEAKRRYQQGLKQSNATIALNYFDSVQNAYYLLGKRAFNNYLATTEKPIVPIVNLKMCRTNSFIN